MTEIALVPYWLKSSPQDSFNISSANLWWFEPLFQNFDYITLLCEDDFQSPNVSSVSSRAKVVIHRITSSLIPIDQVCNEVLDVLSLPSANFTAWHIIEASVHYRLASSNEKKVTAFACIGDMHHMSNAIGHVRKVLSSYRYDYILLTHSQYNHLLEAPNVYSVGKNIFPFPVCSDLLRSRSHTFTVNNTDVNNKPLLLGSNLSTASHPLRQLVASLAAESGQIEILDQRLTFNHWVDSVARAKVILTCSLNGSYSLQTIAPLANESLLITDQISKCNHIGSSLVHGINCLIYEHPKDLLSILQICQDEKKCNLIRENGQKLFLSLQKHDEHVKSIIRKHESFYPFSQMSNIIFHVHNAIVEVIELIQELHRISTRMLVVISSDSPMHVLIKGNLQGLLPRLMLLVLDRESFSDYIKSFGYPINPGDDIFVFIKPITNISLASKKYSTSSILAFKIIEIGKAGEQLYENVYNHLQIITGLPMWKQTCMNFTLILLGSAGRGHIFV